MSGAAPYDRSLALASLVSTMRDHFLDVRCSCGAGRVISLQQMARDPRLAGCTLAHVALRLSCTGCHTGPDQVHLTATISGLGPPPMPSHSLVWTLMLLERPVAGSKHLRRRQQILAEGGELRYPAARRLPRHEPLRGMVRG